MKRRHYFGALLVVVLLVSSATIIIIGQSKTAGPKATQSIETTIKEQPTESPETPKNIEINNSEVSTQTLQQPEKTTTPQPTQQEPPKNEVKNPYEVGFSHWHVFNRRTAVNKPVGTNWMNATQWAYYAQKDGYVVDKSPEIYSMVVKNNLLGFVEGINSDGSVIFSAMNYKSGFYRTDTETIPSNEVVSYTFIH